jgi:hypothetical protein
MRVAAEHALFVLFRHDQQHIARATRTSRQACRRPSPSCAADIDLAPRKHSREHCGSCDRVLWPGPATGPCGRPSAPDRAHVAGLHRALQLKTGFGVLRLGRGAGRCWRGAGNRAVLKIACGAQSTIMPAGESRGQQGTPDHLGNALRGHAQSEQPSRRNGLPGHSQSIEISRWTMGGLVREPR